MAKFMIRVDNKTGMTYFPREIRNEGFIGKIEGLSGALTFTLIKPGANLADVQRSLEIVLQDIALRRRQEGSTNIKMQGEKELEVAEEHKAPASQHPLFTQFTRDWLHQVTGYSKSYLCRVATGNVVLSRPFIERVCFKLERPEAELFSLDVRRDSSP